MAVLPTADEQNDQLEFEAALRTIATHIDQTIPDGVTFALMFFDDELDMPIAFLSNNEQRDHVLSAIERTVHRMRSMGAG